MTDNHHDTPRDGALDLLNNIPTLSHKEAGFLGHVAVAEEVTPKQLAWLTKLLDRKGRAPLRDRVQ